MKKLLKDFSDFYKKSMTPQEFIKFRERDPNNIEAVEIVPPKLGEPGFGRMVVTRKFAEYERCTW